MTFGIVFCFCSATLFLLPVFGLAGKLPWQRRVGAGVVQRHNLSYRQITSDIRPKEPDSPFRIDPEKFKNALSILCGAMPKERLDTISSSILTEGERFKVDPFIIGALVIHQSGCRPRTPEGETRWGLTRLDIDMHAPQIRSGEYRYFVKQGGEWTKKSLEVKAYRFNQWSAQKIEANLYFASAILSVFAEQCPDLDAEFGSVPHRHFVSHWFFGDKVTGIEPEDAVLTVRRRLLSRYLDEGPRTAGVYNEMPLVFPLDGTPRLMIDYFGNKRGQKKTPGHRGIDIAGLTGEPVYAIADGRISFAGADMPGTDQSRSMTPEEAAAIPGKSLGKGGLWIIVNHQNGMRSCYMHLDSISVKEGDAVKAGDRIGALGNTGTVSSGPHLHLEFRTGKGERVDPALYLKEGLIRPSTNPDE